VSRLLFVTYSRLLDRKLQDSSRLPRQLSIISLLLRVDYNQYTVNQTVPVQQPNVKISEVNTKQYQKPKKIAVNEADKYNLNQDVQDYDIYENQVGRYQVGR